ncbi:DUF86 domain-containing protein [Lacibacter sp. MH-610]|uniref:HepT-like ribonuclease domain-containing protein n=1 Tax=Lacibacter sp. MH-610 TaxID=3020883 RepID=UPI0038925352
MQLEIKKYLLDIESSIEIIYSHISNTGSYSEFKENQLVYDAVERRLGIIGEAVWQIDAIDPKIDFTDKKKIIGFRHIVTHDYDLVTPDIIWKIVKVNIPVLEQEVKKYLNR